jgi:HAD superfamily hydrolase (TIGR01490 family)
MSPVLAFFDMDYTVLDASSGLLYAKYLRHQHRLSNRLMLRIAWYSVMYKISAIDVNSAVPKMLAYAEHQSTSRMLAEAYVWFEDMLKAHISPRAVDKMRQHQAQSHTVILISASTQFAVRPVAEYLHVDFLCTHLIDRDDVLTGEVSDPPCYGPGKIVWAQRYATEHGATLQDAYLYTDSYSDRPLLDQVGHPIAVNPDTRLKRLAQRRGWPIEKFH